MTFSDTHIGYSFGRSTEEVGYQPLPLTEHPSAQERGARWEEARQCRALLGQKELELQRLQDQRFWGALNVDAGFVGFPQANLERVPTKRDKRFGLMLKVWGLGAGVKGSGLCSGMLCTCAAFG